MVSCDPGRRRTGLAVRNAVPAATGGTGDHHVEQRIAEGDGSFSVTAPLGQAQRGRAKIQSPTNQRLHYNAAASPIAVDRLETEGPSVGLFVFDKKMVGQKNEGQAAGLNCTGFIFCPTICFSLQSLGATFG